MISFVLFPQASLPSMNLNISELVYLGYFFPAQTNERKKVTFLPCSQYL